MPLTSDTFIERNLLKRQVAFWRLAAVGVMVFFLIVLVERNAKISQVTDSDGYVARVKIQGVVGENQKFYDLLDDIKEDDDIKAVLLHLDTPGGTAVGGEALYKKIKDINSVKPVVVSMRSVCASAGYMISLAADQVYAMSGTITGSIGVIFQTAEFSELASKVGVTPITVRSGPLKGTPSMAEPLQPHERAVLQDMIDEFHTVFVTMVSEGRNLDMQTVRNIADGRIYSAPKALELGLIDAIGGEDEAFEWLVAQHDIDESLEIKDMGVKSKFDNILDRFAKQTGLAQLTEQLDSDNGMLLLWKPELY